jgi:ribosomal protein S18 acetylase RimI-like enzyme
MTIWLATKPNFRHPHIRPFAPQRDLAKLADLIEIAFGRELALTESRMARDMRQVAQWGPVLQAAQSVMPLFIGYVWVEDSKLVGNVSLSRDKRRDTWVIANVAVLPEYRGRGIAGQLVDVAIDHVRSHNGRLITLQVRADNNVAITLYKHRGFVRFDTSHELRLSSYHWPLLLGSPSKALRPVRGRDQAALLKLVCESTSGPVLRRIPPQAADFRRDILWRLSQQLGLMLGKAILERVVNGREGLVAHGALNVHLLRGYSELSLHVLPQERGRWEMALVEGLFYLVSHLPRQSVRAYISTSHPEALEALDRYGFETLRVLDDMALDL